MYSHFLTYCQRKSISFSPCQRRLAEKYFTDKKEFARVIVHGPRPARCNTLLDAIKRFEAEDGKHRVNVRTLP